VRDDGRVVSARGWYVAPALALVLVVGGCSDASPDSPPSGVDELVIPTPSPDPHDFVRGVDNPWLALEPGATWRYAVDGTVPGRSGTLVVTVEDTTYDVAGVATTPVSRTWSGGEQDVDYYAQDRRGNVWWFGREGVWLAGQDGAEAGLAMPATPRLGDGWRAAYAPDTVDVRMTDATDSQLVSTPAGTYRDVLGLDVTDPHDPVTEKRSYYARGVGLVEEFSVDGPSYRAELESAPS
jgi:hypothetical protein